MGAVAYYAAAPTPNNRVEESMEKNRIKRGIPMFFAMLIAVVMAVLVSSVGVEFISDADAAQTFSNNKRIAQKYTGQYKLGVITITLDDTGSAGFPVTAANLSLSGIIGMFPAAVIAGGYACTYDTTNSVLWVYQGDNDNSSDSPFIVIDDGDVEGAALQALYLGY